MPQISKSEHFASFDDDEAWWGLGGAMDGHGRMPRNRNSSEASRGPCNDPQASVWNVPNGLLWSDVKSNSVYTSETVRRVATGGGMTSVPGCELSPVTSQQLIFLGQRCLHRTRPWLHRIHIDIGTRGTDGDSGPMPRGSTVSWGTNASWAMTHGTFLRWHNQRCLHTSERLRKLAP